MKRADFIDYLKSKGCLIIREDRKGYTVFRNVMNGNMSGVPKNDPLRHAGICRVCKTLDVIPPEEAISAQGIVDFAHQTHLNK